MRAFTVVTVSILLAWATAGWLYNLNKVDNLEAQVNSLRADQEEILAETKELGWISNHGNRFWQDGHLISHRFGALLYNSLQDTIPDTIYATPQAQVDSLMTTRHCQVESCLLDDSDLAVPNPHGDCYWERQYAELCSSGYAGMVAARKDASECLRGWELEVLRRKELEAELKIAAAELVVLRSQISGLERFWQTAREGEEEGK